MFGFARPSRFRVFSAWRVAAVVIISSLLAVGVAAAASGDTETIFGSYIDPSRANDGQAVIVEPGGMIVVVGYSCPQPGLGGFIGCDVVLTRYDADLQLDLSFSGDGIQMTDLGGGENVADLALQSNGKYVVAGNTDDSYFVARFNPDGELDTSFNAVGFYSAAGYHAGGLVIQPDGKILTTIWLAGPAARASSVGVQRLNPDGSPDHSFGFRGTATLRMAPISATLSDLALQPDGRILVAGYARDLASHTYLLDFFAARLTDTGKLDPTFGEHGQWIMDLGGDDGASNISLQPDGRIVLAGIANGQAADLTLVRLTPEGELDSSFGETGIVHTDFTAGADDSVYDSLIQADGKILIVGATNSFGSHRDVALARYDANGNLDSTFGTEGKVIAGLGFSNVGNSIALQPDGKYVITGTYRNFISFFDPVTEIYDILMMRVLP